MKKAGEATTNTPSAAMMTFASIWNLCSTAARRPQDKENHCARSSLVLRFRRHTGEGRDVGCANYKARLNLRASSATAAKLRDA